MSRVILLALLLTTGSAAQAEMLKFCGDNAGWPPYTYENDGAVKGYDLDVLAAIFDPMGVKFEVQMLPWKRCMQDTDAGRIHVALSASANDERRKTFRLTDYYYTVQPSFIYQKSRFPDGIQMSAEEAKTKYRICGLRGYNYSGFGIDSEAVERTTNNFEQLLSKTAAGRCDIALARYEILAGFELIGKKLLTDAWAHNAIPGIAGDKFYMLVSRNIPNSEQLEKQISDGIAKLRSEGELEELLKPYF